MRQLGKIIAALVVATAALHGGVAVAALGGAKSGIEAAGKVDLDGFGPGTPISSSVESEVNQPFTRSVVTVADAQPGLYSYFSSADIGNLALKVAGSLTNNGPSDLSDPEVGLLRASSEVRDLITLSTTRTDSFDVTLELIVNGSIDAGTGSVAMANSVLQFGPDPGSNTFDSNTYGAGPIHDVLSITRTVSGPEISMDFQAFLSLNILQVAAGDTVTGLLNNTAFIKLTLPQDVTITSSQSGTFGVPIPQAVPEPQTWLLMSAGLALLIRAGSRRLRRT